MEQIYKFQRCLFFIGFVLSLSLPLFASEKTNTIGKACAKEDIVIVQAPTAPLPNGVPTYTVRIFNTCVSGCKISKIHVRCGWFSSVRLVNPSVFRRVRYDDCLVNDGHTLPVGQTISFQYANTFPYTLSLFYFSCL
ncbi:unnamed protein product [Cochlearia groenlandica]